MSRRTGFTSIELLVVIAIIAILMAILIPTLHRAHEQGQCAACLSNLRQLTVAWMMCAGENDNKIVRGCTGKADLHRVQEAVWGKLGYTPAQSQ